MIMKKAETGARSWKWKDLKQFKGVGEMKMCRKIESGETTEWKGTRKKEVNERN